MSLISPSISVKNIPFLSTSYSLVFAVSRKCNSYSFCLVDSHSDFDTVNSSVLYYLHAVSPSVFHPLWHCSQIPSPVAYSDEKQIQIWSCLKACYICIFPAGQMTFCHRSQVNLSVCVIKDLIGIWSVLVLFFLHALFDFMWQFTSVFELFLSFPPPTTFAVFGSCFCPYHIFLPKRSCCYFFFLHLIFLLMHFSLLPQVFCFLILHQFYLVKLKFTSVASARSKPTGIRIQYNKNECYFFISASKT